MSIGTGIFLLVFLVPIVFIFIYMERAYAKVNKLNREERIKEERLDSIASELLEFVDVEYCMRMQYHFDKRTKFYSEEYDKYFTIQHMPYVVKMCESGTDISVFLREHLSMNEEMSYYIATDKYNKDIGLDQNLCVSATRFNQLLTEEQRVTKLRTNKLKRILKNS